MAAYKGCAQINSLSSFYESLDSEFKLIINERIDNNGTGSCLLRMLRLPAKVDVLTHVVDSLISRYDVKNQCFDINGHHLNVTLEDVLYLTGLPIRGEALTTSKGRDPDGFSRVFGLEKKQVQVTELKNFARKTDNDCEKRIMAMLLMVISCFIIPNKDGSKISSCYVQFVEELDKVDGYAWGAALLSYFYRGIADWKTVGAPIKGNIWVVLGFFLLRLRSLRTLLGIEIQLNNLSFPILQTIITLVKPISKNHRLDNQSDIDSMIAHYSGNDIEWSPYKSNMLPDPLHYQLPFGTVLAPLFCMSVVVYHTPHRVAKQFAVFANYDVARFKWKEPRIKHKQNRGGGNQDFKKIYAKEYSAWLSARPAEELMEEQNISRITDESSFGKSSSEEIGLEDDDNDNLKKGDSKVGFILTSPDLVICSGSPDIPNQTREDSPKLSKRSSLELSFENDIADGSKIYGYKDTPVISKDGRGSSEDSFELHPLPLCEDNEEECDELMKAKRELEVMKRENECKSKECEEALKSLRELQNELMIKSMHVGSLVEGQVKEKSKWLSSLRDMSRKLKIMKMDQIKLLEEAEVYKKHAADMKDMSCIIQSKIDEEVKQHEDLKIRFNKGAKERKELYNKIQELKGNIRAFCRCRPLNSKEIAEGASMAFDFEASKDGELRVKSNVASKKTFKFDSVFSPQANQVDVFRGTSTFATSVLDGYNVCMFAYGQTGSGKTFTMEGTEENRGVNFRTLEELFRVIDERKNHVRYEIRVSVLEVYNEQIHDLLLPSQQPGAAAKRLEVRQDGEGLHHVPGLVEVQVSNMGEVWEVLKAGSNSRAVGSTNANEHSSRSHCMHCVMVKGEDLVNGECTRSKLWLVDLAGSESVGKSGVQGERLVETQNINRSICALGDVISALAIKSPHIPFRNSKLTHLLQDSLGGDSKTLMFVQISPNENDLSESICSLNFASRVRGIELGPAKKQIEKAELLKYKQMAERDKQEMKNKNLQIKKLEDNLHGLDMKLKEKELKNKILQDKVKELESQLLVERQLTPQRPLVEKNTFKRQQIQRVRGSNVAVGRVRVSFGSCRRTAHRVLANG